MSKCFQSQIIHNQCLSFFLHDVFTFSVDKHSERGDWPKTVRKTYIE